MPGLVDIIALRETVSIEGVPITVRGLSITTIGRCLSESDDLQRFWANRKFDAVALIGALPRTIARVVATAIIDQHEPPKRTGMTGFPGAADDQPLPDELVLPPGLSGYDAAREHTVAMNMVAFDELIADHQLTLVEAVIRVSFPGGVTPFVDRVRRLVGLGPIGQNLKDRFTRAQAGSSPQESTNLSGSDIAEPK